jgi:hypothetical protein|nr:MAG TPA: hemolysin [Caudoviricetes sp.]
MNYDLLIAGAALFVTIIVNIVLIAFFSGTLKANQTHQKEMLEFLRLEFKEHFDRLESKQDKHNNLIERMVVVEQSCKSAHHRIDDFEGVHHE